MSEWVIDYYIEHRRDIPDAQFIEHIVTSGQLYCIICFTHNCIYGSFSDNGSTCRLVSQPAFLKQFPQNSLPQRHNVGSSPAGPRRASEQASAYTRE